MLGTCSCLMQRDDINAHKVPSSVYKLHLTLAASSFIIAATLKWYAVLSPSAHLCSCIYDSGYNFGNGRQMLVLKECRLAHRAVSTVQV